MSVRKMVPLYVARGIANPESPDPIAHAVDAIPVADMREAWWCDTCEGTADVGPIVCDVCNAVSRRVLIADAPENAT